MKNQRYKIKQVPVPASINVAPTVIQAGFPSPADDFKEDEIDLNDILITNKKATFLVKVSGDSMIDIGIYPGDKLLVDRSLKPRHNSIVIACIENEFTVKRLIQKHGKWLLKAENKQYSELHFCSNIDFILGVVTFNLHAL